MTHTTDAVTGWHGPATPPSTDSTQRSALAGLKVLELGQWVAGPYCTALLGDLGADVIKIEKPHIGDDQRHSPPFIDGECALFMQINRNKRSLVLDLSLPEDRARCKTLALSADVVVDNLRPGVLKKMGLAYADLAPDNPRLVYCAVSGFGATGELAARAGMDLIAQAMSGVMMLNKSDEGRPQRLPIALADLSTAMHATIGILAALQARHSSGRGQFIDLSLLDGLLSIMPLEISAYLATGAEPPRYDMRISRNAVPYQVFPTQDGWIAWVAGSDALWQRSCDVLGCAHLAHDERFNTNGARVLNGRELEALLEQIFLTQSTAHWLEKADRERIPVSPVFTLPDIMEHPHLAQRETLMSLQKDGRPAQRAVLSPLKMDSTPVRFTKLSPRLGEHTQDILAKLQDSGGWPAAQTAVS